MKRALMTLLLLLSIPAFAHEEYCTTGFMNQAGNLTQYGYHRANLKECLKYANDVIKSMNAGGSTSTLLVQHPGIGDSQIMMRIEGKQDLSKLNN